MRVRSVAVSALVLGWASAGAAQTVGDGGTIARRFGAVEDVRAMSLSPDGTKIAYVVPADNASVAYVVSLAAPGSPLGILAIQAKDGRLRGCAWITDMRLVCRVQGLIRDGAGRPTAFTRLYAVNADRTDLVRLTTPTNVYSAYMNLSGGGILDRQGMAPGEVLMTRSYVPNVGDGSLTRANKEGLGVDSVDVVTQKRKTVEQPNDRAFGYISDGYGTVRIMATTTVSDNGYLTGLDRYFFRRPGARGWDALSTTQTSAEGQQIGFNPAAVDRDKNVVYGFDDLDGFTALYSMSLDGLGTKAVVLSRPDADVDGLITIGPHNRVVGATYANDRRVVEYFDPALARLRAALGKALPTQPSVDVIDSSADESKLLLAGSGDTDPGMYYLYDKSTHQLGPIMPSRSSLAGFRLAPMKPVSFKAADGTLIPGYLTLPVGSSGKGIPAIVMPHGGPAARDEWGFDWMVQFFAARGYAVLQPNFRGSTGYGAAWFQKNGFQSWRTAIGDVNDAGRWLLSEGIAAPGKLAIFGWSYGGYAALQGAVTDPDLYRAVVAVAPVTDLDALKRDALVHGNGRLVERFVGSGPHVHDGSPAQNAERIKVPVLLFHGDMDMNVNVEASRFMERRLKAAGKAVTYVEFPGLEHQLDSTEARTRVLQDSDALFRKVMGLAP